jgi:hypothetical protein
MGITLRKFNNSGLKAFASLIEEFRQKNDIDKSKLIELVFNDEFTEIVNGIESIEETLTAKKIEVAKYLSETLDLKNNRNFYYDIGLWAWLSAFYFELLIPKSSSGQLKFSRDNSLYIPMPLLPRNRWHRHLLAFATWVYTDLGQKGKIYLRGQIYERGEIVEQLGAASNIQRNEGIIEAATVLFYDEKTDTIKRGAASGGESAGTSVRFREVLQQFKITFDLNAMNGLQIVRILPQEFDRWRQAS